MTLKFSHLNSSRLHKLDWCRDLPKHRWHGGRGQKMSQEAVAGGEAEVADEAHHLVRLVDAVAPREQSLGHAFLGEPLHVLQRAAQADLDTEQIKIIIF